MENKETNNQVSQLIRGGGHLVSMVGGADVEGLKSRDITGVNVMTQTTTEQLDGLVPDLADHLRLRRGERIERPAA